MVSAILAIFVWIGIAQSMAIIANSGFKSIKSGRTAIQAQQYADISIDRLKNINYDELDTAGAHTRAVISGLSTTDWEDEVTIGAESTIAGSDDVKQRIATVNVYKTGDTLPRYTVEVPLSSQDNNSIGFPDYENGYSVSSDFIANKNGWLYSSAIGRWIVLINGKPVRQQVINADQVDGAIAPISSGDKVQVIMTQGGSRLKEIIFYPCK